MSNNQLLYAIGDIHGCFNALNNILKAIHNDRQGDPAKVVFLGDYVDRGPDSALVVDHLNWLKTKNPDAEVEYVFLKGNHEDMLIDDNFGNSGWGGYIMNGGRQTNQSYVQENLTLKDHIEFYRGLERFHRHGEFLFVHAGIPGIADRTIAEVTIQTQVDDHLIWDRQWTTHDGEFPENVFVIHGHTPVPSVVYNKNQINIDTGCVFGKKYSEEYGLLTAIRLDGRTPEEITLFQVREFEGPNDD